MNILITGGAGFIGSHLAKHLHRRSNVRVLDDLRTGCRHNLAGLDVEFIHGSILDRRILGDVMQNVDHVYHLAALVGVQESMENAQDCLKLNLTGFLNVLEAAALVGVRKLCFSSLQPSTETIPLYPNARTCVPIAEPIFNDKTSRRKLLSAVHRSRPLRHSGTSLLQCLWTTPEYDGRLRCRHTGFFS